MSFIKNILSVFQKKEIVPMSASMKPIQLLSAKENKKGYQPKLQRLSRYYIDLAMENRDAAIRAAESFLNPDRRMLYALYEAVMEDGHLSSQIQTRILKSLGERFVLINKSGKIGSRFNEELIELFKTPWFYEWCELSLESIFWGHSLIEFHPLNDEGEFETVTLIWREHVKPESGELLLQVGDQKGLPYRESPVNKYIMEIGDCYDLGLLKKASRYVILKRWSLTDWAKRGEKYGLPWLIVKTATTDEKELDAKEDMAANMGSNGYAILDDQDEVQLVESNQAFTWQIFDGMAERMDAYLSKLVNGQTMTSDDGSSLSQAQVHERVLNTITGADMRWLSFKINHELFPFLIKHGYPLKDVRFDWHILTEEYEEETKEQAEKKKTGETLRRLRENGRR